MNVKVGMHRKEKRTGRKDVEASVNSGSKRDLCIYIKEQKQASVP